MQQIECPAQQFSLQQAHPFFPYRNTGTDLDANFVSVSLNSKNDQNVEFLQNLQVTGTSSADTILLKKSPTNADYLEVFVNNVREFTGLRASVDSILVNAGEGNDVIDASAVTFATPLPVTINGQGGNDTLFSGGGNDTLNGGAGDDIYRFTGSNNLGEDTIAEAASQGVDTFDFTNFSYGFVLRLTDIASQQIVAPNGGQPKLKLTIQNDSAIDNVIGTGYADDITGNSLANDIRGGFGNDVIHGGGGADYLDGGYDMDYIYGDDGNDLLYGGISDDVLWGGEGDDFFSGGYGVDVAYGEGGTADYPDGTVEWFYQ